MASQSEVEPSGTPPGAQREAVWAREKAEPHETPRGLPLLMGVLLGAIGAWGGTYFWYEAGDGSDYLLGDGRVGLREGLRGAPEAVEAAPSSAAPGPDGAQVFTAICASCHQANGQGVTGAFPPLVESDWVLGDPRRPVGIVLQGLAGAIEVRGETYNGVMPAFGGQLSDAEVAAVLTYVRSAWGNDADPVPVQLVTELRGSLSEQGMLQGGAGVNALAP